MSNSLEMINRHADRPVYRQLSDLLAARLAEEFRPGDRLPSEAVLSQEFDVNRLTVRRALEELNQLGLIETVHGKGSFVASPPVRYDVSAGRDASFTRSMSELGHRVAIVVLSSETVAEHPTQTELQTTGPVLVTTTLRLVDDEPYSLSVTALGIERFPQIAQQWAGEASLFDFLLDTYGVRMHRANRTFAATLAEPAEAEYLRLRIGGALLEMGGLNIDQDGRPVAVVKHRYRGDRVQFTVDLG